MCSHHESSAFTPLVRLSSVSMGSGQPTVSHYLPSKVYLDQRARGFRFRWLVAEIIANNGKFSGKFSANSDTDTAVIQL